MPAARPQSLVTLAPALGSTIPPEAARRVEFISLAHLNPSTELAPQPTRGIDPEWTRRYVHALEDGGFDYTLLPYGSAGADSLIAATAVATLGTKIKPVVALRPNTEHPLTAAQKLATLDQFSQGRVTVHLITGGNDAEQARLGDYLPKSRRYARTSEYVDLLRRAWSADAPFSYESEFYRFDEFGPGLPPYGETIPISVGGASDEAFEVGGAKADVFSFWGEPLAEIRKGIERVNEIARRAGRADRPRIWVTFRPIIAPTDDLAWQKAHEIVDRLVQTFPQRAEKRRLGRPENVGAQRNLAFAAQAELFDRALWTPTTAVTGGGGASTALVGSPETVAAAVLDYVDLGADLISIRGYDTLNDVIDYGRHLLPLVRQELAHREATGQRGALQGEHPGGFSSFASPSTLDPQES